MRTYKQYCPLAKTLDIIGERWGMLIIRDLSLGPKRFVDLEKNLRGIGKNLLSKRLKELSHAEVIIKKYLEPPVDREVYMLTDLGDQLKRPLLLLAQWGTSFIEEKPSEGEQIGWDWRKILKVKK